MTIIFKERYTTSFFMWTGYLSAMFIMTFLNSFIPQTSATFNASLNALGMLVFLLLQFALTFNYKSSLIRRVTAVGILIILDAASAFLNVIVFFLFSSVQLTVWSRDFLVHLCSTLLLYLLLTIISKKSQGIRKNTFDSKKFLILILLPIFTFFSLFLYVAQVFRGAEVTFIIIILIFVLVFALMCLIFTYYNNASESQIIKLQSEVYEKEKDYYLVQCQMMQESVEQMKAFRHDIKLHLATIENYIKENPEAALVYVKHLTGDITQSETYSDTGNIALDSIINFKLKSVKADGIEVDLDIFAPVIINIEASDIVVILGNLLDNALEALSRVNEKIINVYISYQKGNLLIRVENTFNGVVKKDFATLKSGDGHGYGLSNVRKSADKYNGMIDVSHETGWFTVEVLLYG